MTEAKAKAEPTTVPTINQALSAVMAEVLAVRKDSKNQQQGFNFRGIDAVMNAVGPAFRAHGVVTMPHVIDYTTAIVATKNGGTMNHVILHTRYEFIGPASDAVSCEVYGEAMDSGDKAMSKAHSVAYRTALLQVLTIPTDEPDPDATAYERDVPAAQAAAKPAASGTKLASEQQVALILALAKDLGWADEYLTDTLKRKGHDHPGDLTGGREGEASKMIDYMTGKVNALKAEKDAERKAAKDATTAEAELGGEEVNDLTGPEIPF